MWKPVTKDGESLGLVAATVGELKEMLKYVPDKYTLSATGTTFGMVVDDNDEIVLIDDITYLENLLIEQEEK